METRVSSHGSGQGQAADAKLRLMAVHAHPDDESSKGAATMARYVREGVEVLVATMTGGERGSVLNKAMDRPEVLADLPNIRRAEMAGPGRSSASSSASSASPIPACPRGTRCRRCPRAASASSRWPRRRPRWSAWSASSSRT